MIDRDPLPASLTDRNADFIRLDLTDRRSVDVAARQILIDHPHLAGVIVSAGIAGIDDFDTAPIALWDTVLNTNVTATIRLIHALLPALETHASAVGVADIMTVGASPTVRTSTEPPSVGPHPPH